MALDKYNSDGLAYLRDYPAWQWPDFLAPAAVRVAHAMRLMADDDGRLYDVSLQDIASAAGVSKRSVTRALQAMADNALAYVEESGRDKRAPSIRWVAMPPDTEAARGESAAALAIKPRGKRKKRPGAKGGARRGN